MKRPLISVNKLLLGSILVVSLSITSCKKEVKKVTNQTEIQFKKEGELNLFKSESDSLVKTLDIEIADNDYETQTGLMHRTSMKDSQGMLFIFNDNKPRYFYMKNTRIPLDIIYIGENKKIVSTQLNAKPMNETTLPSNANAKYVLEVNAGLFETWNLKVGDSIAYTKD